MAGCPRNPSGLIAVILVLSLALVWFVLPDREVPGNAGMPQSDGPAYELSGQAQGALPDQDVVAHSRVEELAPQSDTALDEPAAPSGQNVSGLDSPTYFSNPREYLETYRHWGAVFAADRAGWVDRLDERFDLPIEVAALEGESDLARRAVLEHPGYSYTPGISLSSLTAECRNMICKVDVAPNHKSELVFDYGGRDPSTGLTSMDEVLFRYNFGHHVSKFDSITGVETHYLLVNGFDFR